MKFLITGGSGFVGKKFSEELIKKYGSVENEFVFIARKTGLDFLNNHKHAKIKIVSGDISDYDSIKDSFNGVDYVFHLAAKVDYGDFNKDAYYKINIEGTKNVFELSLKNKVKKVVYLSTAAIFHPTYENYAHEDTEIKKGQHLTHYTKSKHSAYEFIKEYQDKGLNIVAVLPSSVFDYGAPLFEPFILMSLKYRIVFLPKNRGRMSLVFLDDLVNCLFAVMQENVNNEVVIVSDIDMSLVQIVKKIENIYRKKIFIIKLPNSVLKYYFLLADFVLRIFGKKVFLNHELFKFVNANFLVKSRKFGELTGCQFENFENKFDLVIKKYIKLLNK